MSQASIREYVNFGDRIHCPEFVNSLLNIFQTHKSRASVHFRNKTGGDLVVCIPTTAERLVLHRSPKTQGACRSIRDSTEGLTVKIELVQCLIEMPRSVRALAGLQGGGDGLGSFISNVVVCIPTTAVRLVIMLRSLKAQGACRSIRDSAEGLTINIEHVQCLIEMPRSVRALAGLQGGGDGLGPFISNLVTCIPTTAERLVIMLRSLKTQEHAGASGTPPKDSL